MKEFDKLETIFKARTPGPWHRMAGAEWNVLDDKGIRLAIVGSDGNFALDGLPDARFIAVAGTVGDLMLDVVRAAALARSTTEPVLANYVLLDHRLTALRAALKEMP